MSNQFRIVCLGAALLMACWNGADARGSIVIDTFTNSQGPIVQTAPGTTTDGIAAGGAIGGARKLALTQVSASGILIGSVNVDVPNSASYGTIGGTGSLLVTWDRSTTGPLNPIGLRTGGVGVNLSESGINQGIRFQQRSDNSGGAITFKIYTDGTNFSTATIPTTPGGTFTESFIPFSSFVIAGGTGADFTNVGAITLLLDGTGAPDIDIAVGGPVVATTLPEPASGILLALGTGIAGLFAVRRRGRKIVTTA